MNANKTMDDCKRGFVGVPAKFRCGDRSSAQQCGLPISAVAPNPSCAHATAATPVVEESSRAIKSGNMVMPSDASDEADPAGPGPSRSGLSRSGLVGGGWRWMDGLMDG